MAAKTSWHRYVTKLRHCNPMYILPAGPTAANPPERPAAVDRRNRQTGRRKDTVPLHTDPAAYYASSVNKQT